MIKLQKAMIETGTTGSKALKALGVDLSQPLDKALADVAEKLQGIKDPILQTTTILAIFGKNGAALKPLLNEGAEGIAALTEEAKKLGGVFGEETSKQMEEVEKNFKKLRVRNYRALLLISRSASRRNCCKLSEALIDTKNEADDALKETGKEIGEMLNILAQGAATVAAAFQAIENRHCRNCRRRARYLFSRLRRSNEAHNGDDRRARSGYGRPWPHANEAAHEPIKEHYISLAAATKTTKENADATAKLKKLFEDDTAAKKAAAEAVKAWNEEKRKALELAKAGRTDYEKYVDAVMLLDDAMKKEMIDQHQRDEGVATTRRRRVDYRKATEKTEALTDAEKESDRSAQQRTHGDGSRARRVRKVG